MIRLCILIQHLKGERHMIKKMIVFLLLVCMLCGCQQQSDFISDKQFCLDTIVEITLYDSKSRDILKQCFDLCDKYELVFSSTNEKSELYKINHSNNKLQEQTISDDLYEVINEGLKYCEMSDGQFDITIGSISSLWDFKSSNPEIPDQNEINANLQNVSYKNIQLSKNKITYSNENTMIDLGAIAKGYIADQIKNYLLDKGVHSALINLGGNILCIGNKLDEKFMIGLTDPQATNQSILSLQIDDMSVVTSGTYQRYFEVDGQIYHHILNPKTGYSYDNGLTSVTIISQKSIQGDALSTVCFALGKEKGIELLNSIDHVSGCFIDDHNQISYSKGFKKYIK